MKYSNIEIPEIDINDISPEVYFSDVICPNCKCPLCSDEIRVANISTGHSFGSIETTSMAHCSCKVCKTKFDAETTIYSKFSIGLFAHMICCIVMVVAFILTGMSLIGMILTELMNVYSIRNNIFAVFIASLCILAVSGITGSILETCNDDCCKYVKTFNK